MHNELTGHENVTSLGDRRRPRGSFSRHVADPVEPAPMLSLLPDMSHTNGRGVVELVAQALRQHG